MRIEVDRFMHANNFLKRWKRIVEEEEDACFVFKRREEIRFLLA